MTFYLSSNFNRISSLPLWLKNLQMKKTQSKKEWWQLSFSKISSQTEAMYLLKPQLIL